MITIRNNNDRAKIAKVGMWASLAGSLLIIGIHVYSIKFLTDASSGLVSSFEQVQSFQMIVFASAAVFLGIFVFSAITFIQWFRRAYFNLHKFYPKGMRFSEGWAAGAWFVPILNLFRPYQIANELYDKTEKLLEENELAGHDSSRQSIVGWWWALWIISSIVSQVGSKYPEGSIDDVITGNYISLVAGVISMGCAFLAIKVISNYNKMERLLSRVEDVKAGGIEGGDSELLDSDL